MAKSCEFSEFTYGYVFTDERMKAGKIHVAPIFPTLHQEHKHGGYDVEISGVAFVQFKRPDVYEGNRCREVVAGKLTGRIYRMKINQQQHETLRNFEKTVPASMRLFYACPCFHTVGVLNTHYGDGSVMRQSAIFRPTSIGKLTPGPHHVSFTRFSLSKGRAYCYSERGERVQADNPEQVEDWITEIANGPEIPLPQLISLISDLRGFAGSGREPPGTALNADSSKRDAVVALARVAQVNFDMQPLIIGRVPKEAD
jgi:hypothetical protein